MPRAVMLAQHFHVAFVCRLFGLLFKFDIYGIAMSNKLKKKGRKYVSQEPRDSVFKEAWENMNHDMARFLPGFLTKRTPKGKRKLWVVIVVTLFELLLLGAAGKIIYDWFAS